jgi:DNA-binding CsgD family transcriptional regulator
MALMREVNVRMLHLAFDLARAADVERSALTQGLPSLAFAEGEEPNWVDWDDFIETIERLERLAGGPEALGRAFRSIGPGGYAELRAFAAIFMRPIPLFTFVMTRFMPTMYRHIDVKLERVGSDSLRWRQVIPEGHRGSETFHRGTGSLIEIFPLNLDLPEATMEITDLTPRSADFLAHFPAVAPLGERGARAVSGAASLLAAQFDSVFGRIAESLRGEEPEPMAGPAAAIAWPDRLELSRRQRDVFALLVEGRANKDIAATLRCSERNVEFHVGRILRAAQVTSRSELLVKVLGTRT